MTYEYAQQPALAPEAREPLVQVYREVGISCYLGWDTPF